MNAYSSRGMVHLERGFTLIELLTVIVLIGILSYLSLKGFSLYRANAAYASVESSLQNARIAAEASQTDANHLPPAVPWYFQNVPGVLNDAAASQYLPGFKLSPDTLFWAFYSPGCSDLACISDFIQVMHCKAREFVIWVRWGDGWEFTFHHLPGGAGC